MELSSPSRSTTAEKGETQTSQQKQAACLNCRRSKTRCLRDPGDLKCRKCVQAQVECVIPDYRVGRKKGIKNKRDGLEKAVYRIEQAIKKSKTNGNQSEDDRNAVHLQTLLTEAQGLLPQTSPNTQTPSSNHDLYPSPSHNQFEPANQFGHVTAEHAVVQSSGDDHFEVDDAENPLQLLARASDLSAPSNQSSFIPNIPNHVPRHLAPRDKELKDFFGPFRPSLDTGPDIDPIDLGLVTEEEADMLFTYFYENLSHTRWGLDSVLHTPEFVRKQSCFLFTSIMASSALFIPTAAAISKRLTTHCKLLAQNVMINRNRSPEIVLAFMVNVPWMAPGKHWSDDRTCFYMASALTIAMDISMNKLIIPSPTDPLAGIHEGRPPSDCISARKALNLDGFQDLDPISDHGKRLLRRRERIWLALFVLDRGVCLARGRTFTVPVTPIIEHSDNWHQCGFADVHDGSLVSSTVLRRDLATLISNVKNTCDSNRTHSVSGEVIARSLQNMIDGFFNSWYATWAFAPGGMKDNSIPPYVEILVCHGRLSIYSSVINHPTAPVEVKRFFKAAGLSSSLNVMRAAVQGENRLKSMPNNTAIMISFAACFAFHLSTIGTSGNMSLAPSIRKLIEESAAVLERIGSNPPHRHGASSFYGRHLREVVGTSLQPDPRTVRVNSQPVPIQATQVPSQSYSIQPDLASMQMVDLLQFSAMSDDQINEAINNVGDEIDMYLPSFQMEDQSGLDWLDWFNLDVNVNS